jgi:hypothetical protein
VLGIGCSPVQSAVMAIVGPQALAPMSTPRLSMGLSWWVSTARVSITAIAVCPFRGCLAGVKMGLVASDRAVSYGTRRGRRMNSHRRGREVPIFR